MSALTHSRLRGASFAGASLAAVIAGMSLMEPRVHQQVNQLWRGEGLSPEMASMAHRLQTIALAALDSLYDQSMAHTSLTIFALAAVVLLLLMFRT